jgi:hypothetical protein
VTGPVFSPDSELIPQYTGAADAVAGAMTATMAVRAAMTNPALPNIVEPPVAGTVDTAHHKRLATDVDVVSGPLVRV